LSTAWRNHLTRTPLPSGQRFLHLRIGREIVSVGSLNACLDLGDLPVIEVKECANRFRGDARLASRGRRSDLFSRRLDSESSLMVIDSDIAAFAPSRRAATSGRGRRSLDH
jgi:hypothetical protein